MTSTLPADELVGRWLAAWRAARRLDATDLDGWPCVHVGSRTRETEIVCFEPGVESFTTMLQHLVGDRHAMLTVIAADLAPYRAAPLPSGVRVDRDDEALMTTRLIATEPTPLPMGFAARWTTQPHLATYALEREGRIVSGGAVGVSTDDASFDDVETLARYQRQGLGRHVMQSLVNHAVENGATTGLLAASEQGQWLYASMGWEHALPMWSLMGTGE